MKRTTKDFIILFNNLWYRDFPIQSEHKQFGSRAEWTTHIGICVRRCADLMGFFTYFEAGNRTDAVIKDNKKHNIANIEWEWSQAFRENVNEIKKLNDARTTTDFSVFITYSQKDHHDKNMKSILTQWGNNKEQLIVLLVTFAPDGKFRSFGKLETYEFKNKTYKRIRTQPALPWDIKGSRWELLKDKK